MKKIDCLPFHKPAEKETLLTAIRQYTAVDGIGYCIVDNHAMAADAFMLFLHECLAPSLSISRRNGMNIPYDEVKDRGDAMDKAGALLSFTHQPFPLHTDCCFLERPADLVTLYCVENATEGGESLLLNINEVLHLLPATSLHYLLATPFAFYSKQYPILEQGNQQYYIRFHEGELEDSCAAGDKETLHSVLQPLLALLHNPEHATAVKLKLNQCLIVNNRTCLHGRTAFEAGSPRVFYRSRHYHLSAST